MIYPLITIVTPSYNQADYLPETIDSICSQNYPNLEYIIIDGGSTDASPAIIRQHERHLAYWISAKDHGQADALNKGFARARTDNPTDHLFAYLNSDDLYTAGTLDRIAHAFAEAKAAAPSASPFETWFVGNVANFGVNTTEFLTAYPPENSTLDRWFWFFANPVHQPGTFWSASLFQRLGPFDASLRYVFDYDLFMKFRILANLPPVHINHTVARFRLHELSKTVSQRPKFDAEFETVRARISAQLPPADRAQMIQYVRRTRADRLQADAVQHLRNGNRVPALRDLAQSLWHDPRLLVQRRTFGALKRFIVT